MDEQLKKALTQDSQDWNTRVAVRKLSPEIRATAARIHKQKQDRLQLVGFLAAALALIGAAAYVIVEYSTYGTITKSARIVLITLASGAGIATAFAPILAYFAEEELNHEGT